MTQHHTSRVLVVVGTRPEAVKLAPVLLAVDQAPDLAAVVVATGQHPEMADEALAAFGLRPDVRLDVPARRGWSQGALMAHLLPGLEAAIADAAPDVVLVQGDTASALAGAMAGFWQRVPIVHLEAGLRTPTLAEPFPEEGYRRLIARLAAVHLAPTPPAVAALQAEGVAAETITCTGNTAVDAAVACAARHPEPDVPGLPRPGAGPLALLTVHRRESWGEPLRRILSGVRAVLADVPALRLVVPVHPNPLVHDVVAEELGDHLQVALTEPLPYPRLVALLARADVVLTDSGGIQEEAPTFGTPVVVLRDATERADAVRAGTAWLVGTDPVAIRHRTVALLTTPGEREPRPNPFGDGRAAPRVVAALRAAVLGGPLPSPWVPPAPAPDPEPEPAPAPRPAAARPPDPAVPERPAWVRRMERVGHDRHERPADPVPGPHLTPPEPVTARHPVPGSGALVEVRRGGQLLRHVPGLGPRLVRAAGDDCWVWTVGWTEGDLWVETSGPPVRVRVPGGWCEVRSGAASIRPGPEPGAVAVTVLWGRGLVRGDRGDALPLAPRETTAVRRLGTLTGVGRAAPAELEGDRWIADNRRLSHAGEPVLHP